MAAPMSARRSLGDLPLPGGFVQALAWGLIGLAFALPCVAWMLGVRAPEPAPTAVRRLLPKLGRIALIAQAKLEVVRERTFDPHTGPEADCPGMPLPTRQPSGPGAVQLAGTAVAMKFVWLDSGEFNMGNERFPCHRVAVDAFEIAERSVTNAQWRAVMRAPPPTVCRGKCDGQGRVTDVSWEEAIGFADRLSTLAGLEACHKRTDGGMIMRQAGCTGYRLPTEAEWEYAARAGTVRVDAWAMPSQANPWGLFDMRAIGLEWVWDASGTSPRRRESRQILANPNGLDGYGPFAIDDSGRPRVIRAWSLERSSLLPRVRSNNVGFRVVKGPQRAGD